MSSRRIKIVFIAIGATLTLQGGQAWAKPSPAPCLSPLPTGAKDPDVRNISMFPSTDGSSVTVQSCIVSNRDRLASLGIIFSVFDKEGNFLAAGGQSLGAQSTVDGGQPGQPKIIAVGAAGLAVPRHQGPLLNTVLIQVQWSLCQDPSAKECVSGPVMSTTFLRDADRLLASPARRHAKSKRR